MRLVIVALGWASGIVFAAHVQVSLNIWLLIATVTFTLAVYHRRWWTLFMLCLVLGAARYSVLPTTSPLASWNDSGGLSVEGIVVAPAQHRDTQTLLHVEADTLIHAGEHTPISGGVIVNAPRLTPAQHGDRVIVTGALVTPAESDTFSYTDYLARAGIYSQMTHASVQILESAPPTAFASQLYRIRSQAAANIARAMPEPAASLLTGIVLGDESGISPDVRDAFNTVGAGHIIAISGFNMAVLAGFIERGLTGLRIRRRGLIVAITIGILALYTLFVGASAAVARAALMSSLLLIGGAIRRKTYVPASLAFAVILLSLLNPTVLWDTGFQLSFFAVLGLSLLADPLTTQIARIFPRWIAELLAVTLAAQIATLPLVLLYFGRFSLLSLAANLVITPVQPMILLIGGAAVLLSFVAPVIAQVGFWLAYVPLRWSIDSVRLFAQIPATAFHLHPFIVTLTYAVTLGLAMIKATHPDRLANFADRLRQNLVVNTAFVAGASLLVLIVAALLARPDGNLHIWFLDAGHSNAALIQTPNGAHILIDGGRFPTRLLTALGDRLPFYKQTLDLIIVTQPDDNDISALPHVLNRYDVGKIIWNGQPSQLESFAALAPHAHALQSGYNIAFNDNVRLEILAPQQTPQLGESLDHNALLTRLHYGDISLLLTGDISRDAQEALPDHAAQPVTIAQLPQHATARSLNGDFWRALQPQVAVLQSDRANRRGDPDADTLVIAQAPHLFRTDQHGAIHFWSNGQNLWVQTERH